jgi:hypothetical protein
VSTVDREANPNRTGSSWGVIPDGVADAPNPTRIILVRAGTFSGALPGIQLYVKDSDQFQDSNQLNVQGNRWGYLATYGHKFTTIGTRLLFDLTDFRVYDLAATDSSTLVVIWPR